MMSGWTTRENADAYQELLLSEILRGIESRGIEGYRGAHMLRRDVEDGVEFATICWFDDWDGVRDFAGEDYEIAVVPSGARVLLSHFDERSAHYETVSAPL